MKKGITRFANIFTMFEKLWTIGLFVFVFHFVCRTLYGPYAYLQTVNKHPDTCTRPLHLSGKNKHFFGTQVQRDSLWVPLAQVQELVTFPLDSQNYRHKIAGTSCIKSKPKYLYTKRKFSVSFVNHWLLQTLLMRKLLAFFFHRNFNWMKTKTVGTSGLMQR